MVIDEPLEAQMFFIQIFGHDHITTCMLSVSVIELYMTRTCYKGILVVKIVPLSILAHFCRIKNIVQSHCKFYILETICSGHYTMESFARYLNICV